MRRLALFLCLLCLYPTVAWGQARMASGSVVSGHIATAANTNGLTTTQDCSGLPFLTAIAAAQGPATVWLEVATAAGTNATWYVNTTITLSSDVPTITHATIGLPQTRLRSVTTNTQLTFVLSCKN